MSAVNGANARILVLLGLALLLAGCGSVPEYAGGGTHTHYAPGRPHYTVAPYQINGVWYYPRVDYSYDQTGTASWYGPGFDHRATADGEMYDMNDLSAAHKTLPLPSVVEVTNLQNGRELRLRVNDRGPFVGDRLIDVSRRAAQLLGFEGSGTTPVRVRVLRNESIQVAEAAMMGEMGGVGVAAASGPPVVQRTQLAAAVPPAPPPRRPAPVIAAPLAPSPPAQPLLQPPPQQLAAAAPPPPLEEEEASRPAPQPAPLRSPAPMQTASAHRHYWPSLISSAHAETMRPLLPVAATPVAARSPGRIFIQAGAFAVPENAQRVRARIAELGSAEVLRMTSASGTALYRVRLGPVASAAAAQRLLSKVVGSGYPGARLVEQ